MKQGLFIVGPVLVPLTNDRVISGRCLLCNCLEGDQSPSAETHTAVPITDPDHPIPNNRGCSASKSKCIVLGILFPVLSLVGVGIGVYFFFSRQDETPTITSLPTAIEPQPLLSFTTTSTTTMSDITATIKEPDPTTVSPDVAATVAIDTTTSTETVAAIKEPDLTTGSPDILPAVATAMPTSLAETVATTSSVTAQTSTFPLITKVPSTSIKPTTPVSVTTNKITTGVSQLFASQRFDALDNLYHDKVMHTRVGSQCPRC